MIPDPETVAAPSRMLSTNILYGRSALDSVNTCAAGDAARTTRASTSPLRIARKVSSASLSRALDIWPPRGSSATRIYVSDSD